MRLKILSFNIWDLPLFIVKHRERRFKGLLNYLDEQDADIVCLQESFDVKHRRELYERFKDKYFFSGGLFDIRKILFLKAFDKSGGLLTLSKFPIVESRFVPYSRIFNSAFGEALARKGFLETVLETPMGKLKVINTHLHEEAFVFDRKVRLVQLKKVFRQMNGRGLPGIFIGDFNQHSMARQGDFTELFDSIGFTHPLRADHISNELPSYRPENPYVEYWLNRTVLPKRFDYILVRGLEGLGLRTMQYEPQKLEPALSDHDPVLLTLSDGASDGVV